MIQINLLPDVKLRFIKAKRTKRIVVFASLLVVGAVLVLFVMLFISAQVVQKKAIADLTRDIGERTSKLQSTEDVDRILTVQNQLRNLSTLHENKPAVVRLFTYLGQITPNTASLSEIKFNFVDNKASITGEADKIESINKFVDTLKFTNFSIDPSDKNVPVQPAFSQVVLTSFARSEEKATYQIDFSFDPIIFKSTESKVTLIVPNIITTRSSTEQPLTGNAPLFKENTSNSSEEAN